MRFSACLLAALLLGPAAGVAPAGPIRWTYQSSVATQEYLTPTGDLVDTYGELIPLFSAGMDRANGEVALWGAPPTAAAGDARVAALTLSAAGYPVWDHVPEGAPRWEVGSLGGSFSVQLALSLSLTDLASGASGSVGFPGRADGAIWFGDPWDGGGGWFSVTLGLGGPLSRSLVLGHGLYTVTLPASSAVEGVPDINDRAEFLSVPVPALAADVTVRPTPEPSGLLLSTLGLGALGAAVAWRVRRRAGIGPVRGEVGRRPALLSAIVLLAFAAGAHAGPIRWSYSTMAGEVTLWGHTDTIDNAFSIGSIWLHGIPDTTVLGSSAIPVAVTTPDLSSWPIWADSVRATDWFDARPGLSDFTVSVSITDTASGRSGSVSFPGFASGYGSLYLPGPYDDPPPPPTIAPLDMRHLLYRDEDVGRSPEDLFWYPPEGLTRLTRTLRLGDDVYAVTLGDHPADWGGYPENDPEQGPFSGRLVADVTVERAPEPGTLVLAGVALAGLAAAGGLLRGPTRGKVLAAAGLATVGLLAAGGEAHAEPIRWSYAAPNDGAIPLQGPDMFTEPGTFYISGIPGAEVTGAASVPVAGLSIDFGATAQTSEGLAGGYFEPTITITDLGSGLSGALVFTGAFLGDVNGSDWTLVRPGFWDDSFMSGPEYFPDLYQPQAVLPELRYVPFDGGTQFLTLGRDTYAVTLGNHDLNWVGGEASLVADVTVTTAPEPATLALACTGLSGLAAGAWRARRGGPCRCSEGGPGR